MRFTPCEGLPDVVLVEADVARDARGFFVETFRADLFRAAGLPTEFAQDNHSRSTRGTLRGLHAQARRPQGKLVRVVTGAIHDVAVDLRRGSPTWLRWVAVPLAEGDGRALWIPPGFAHGFCVTSDAADVAYRCTTLWDPADEVRVAWDDPRIGVRWPVAAPVLSAKDRDAPPLAAVEDRLPAWTPGPAPR